MLWGTHLEVWWLRYSLCRSWTFSRTIITPWGSCSAQHAITGWSVWIGEFLNCSWMTCYLVTTEVFGVSLMLQYVYSNYTFHFEHVLYTQWFKWVVIWYCIEMTLIFFSVTQFRMFESLLSLSYHTSSDSHNQCLWHPIESLKLQ